MSKKFKSRNLLGETREQEKKRFSKVANKEFKKTGNPNSYLNLPSTTGATQQQLERRKKLLKSSGLPVRQKFTIRKRKAFL